MDCGRGTPDAMHTGYSNGFVRPAWDGASARGAAPPAHSVPGHPDRLHQDRLPTRRGRATTSQDRASVPSWRPRPRSRRWRDCWRQRGRVRHRASLVRGSHTLPQKAAQRAAHARRRTVKRCCS
jgi:hypothetical protein